MKICFTIDDADEIDNLIKGLQLDGQTAREYFEYYRYATFELDIDEALKVNGGRLVPRAEI